MHIIISLFIKLTFIIVGVVEARFVHRHINGTTWSTYTETPAVIPYSAKFWRGKTLANRSFQSFGEENVGEFTATYILATLVNLEFGWVKYWRMTFLLPNSPKFFPARILHYTVLCKLRICRLYV